MPANRMTGKGLSVGIIGAGPGGLALGIFLSKAGFRNFTIFDREDGVGGTWRINTYPGLACDVKSHLYSYSFDLNANWSRLWSGQPEILDYFEQCAQRSVLPDLVEEEPFTGTLMHTARWDHLVDLRDARVAVLGTGSTASQLVPEVVKFARKVYSVQRSPTWILPKPDRPYTDLEKWVFAHVPLAKKIYRTRLWLRSESNISVIENGSDKTQEFKSIALRVLEATVPDEELRRKLTPDHPFGCKRLVFATDYLQALTRHLPRVRLSASGLGDQSATVRATGRSAEARFASRRQLPRDGGVVGVDIGGIDHHGVLVGQPRVAVCLNGHGACEERDIRPRTCEVVLNGDPALASTIAVAVVPQSSDRIEDEQRGTHGNSEMPRRQLVPALRTAFVPGVAHP